MDKLASPVASTNQNHAAPTEEENKIDGESSDTAAFEQKYDSDNESQDTNVTAEQIAAPRRQRLGEWEKYILNKIKNEPDFNSDSTFTWFQNFARTYNFTDFTFNTILYAFSPFLCNQTEQTIKNIRRNIFDGSGVNLVETKNLLFQSILSWINGNDSDAETSTNSDASSNETSERQIASERSARKKPLMRMTTLMHTVLKDDLTGLNIKPRFLYIGSDTINIINSNNDVAAIHYKFRLKVGSTSKVDARLAVYQTHNVSFKMLAIFSIFPPCSRKEISVLESTVREHVKQHFNLGTIPGHREVKDSEWLSMPNNSEVEGDEGFIAGISDHVVDVVENQSNYRAFAIV